MVILNLDDDESDLELARFAERLKGAKAARDVLNDKMIDLDDELELAPRSALVIDIMH